MARRSVRRRSARHHASTAFCGSLVLIVSTLLAPAAVADKPDVGDPSPAWKALLGTDGKPHALHDYAKARLVVMYFTCNGCPISQANQLRMVELQRDYQSRGVQVIGVNVNQSDDDRMEKMKEISRTHKFNFPYLADTERKVAQVYGAEKTTHIFLLDDQRKLAYEGAIDDSPLDPTAVKKRYLRDAIDALLAGETPRVTKTKAVGCPVYYR